MSGKIFIKSGISGKRRQRERRKRPASRFASERDSFPTSIEYSSIKKEKSISKTHIQSISIVSLSITNLILQQKKKSSDKQG